MAGLFEIREDLINNYERRQFEKRESGNGDDVWGVWDWDKGEWRRPANYTRQEAARMSGFLNRNRP
jgi:hypothetical protein